MPMTSRPLPQHLPWLALALSLLLHLLLLLLPTARNGEADALRDAPQRQLFAYRLIMSWTGQSTGAPPQPSLAASQRSVAMPAAQAAASAAASADKALPPPVMLTPEPDPLPQPASVPEPLPQKLETVQPESPTVSKLTRPPVIAGKELADDDLDQVSPSGYSGSGFALFRHLLHQSLVAQLNAGADDLLECRFKLLMSRREIQVRAVKCDDDVQFQRLLVLIKTDKLPSSFDFGLGPAVVMVRTGANGQIRMD
ncbi:MAG: hypothetical protein EKK59_04160 [Neisseriaceae bacterium]|nr:MAG: hypothetical protein EKK59_04160 [Neisseriaceae bacterium]